MSATRGMADGPRLGCGSHRCLEQEPGRWENVLKDAAQGDHRLRPHHAGLPARARQLDKVKAEYARLKHALTIVTRERDLAVKEKHQLQAKLENLEQVLKHMREAAERRQQLELEHEQALAVLNAKQQEIDLLQKAQVEAKKEHEGAVQLLECRVRELEEKCRAQSEQFSLLSRDLDQLRQHAGEIDLLGGSSLDVPSSPGKPFRRFMNGLAPPIGKGQESSIGSRAVIGEYIQPLPLPGDKPEPLSVKPAFLSRSGGPRCRFESDMDNERNSSTAKQRYSGKVHLCVARYSYNPFDGPNENPEAELPLTAGKYLYVYGDMDEDGFYEGELLDGQRGLVPSNFVDFVQDESRLASTLGKDQEQSVVSHAGVGSEAEHILGLHSPTRADSGLSDHGAGTRDVNIDDVGEDTVPYPRKITLIKQLAKSVIVGWEPPAVPPGWGAVSSYSVLVDAETRLSLAPAGRTKALVEKLNMAACTYRISVQCVTSRGSSDKLRCTLLVGKDVVVAPSHLRVDSITQVSARLSWAPANSNYSHAIFLNEQELDVVRAASYKYQFCNLRPNAAYKVKVLAKPHQMPWQLPLEQRERKEAFVEFSTLPAGPPAPPQDIAVQAAATPGTVQVSWKPPALTATGLSNGANVTGYGVYAKGQRVAEIISPTADGTAVELVRLRSLEAKSVTVRTLSAQGESVDSAAAAIPPDLLVPPAPHLRTAPTPKPLASAGAPDTKDEHLGPHAAADEAWELGRAPAPAHGHLLEPPGLQGSGPGRRSPSPSRILPQPQGAPVSTSVAKAMAREAAQRVAESSRIRTQITRGSGYPPAWLSRRANNPLTRHWSVPTDLREKRSIFLERSSGQYANSDEEDGYESPDVKRRGASVDEFLKGSELGKPPHCCHGDEYHTESSRGSDLSDIMEEDEEELYSEMQLEDGGRRRPSGTSHNALKECSKNRTTERAFWELPECPQQTHHSKKLFSIPEVAEEDGEPCEFSYKQGVGVSSRARTRLAREPRPARPCRGHEAPLGSRGPAKPRGPRAEDFVFEDRGCRFSRSAARSPDSGLDCGSEEEETRFSFRSPAAQCSPGPGHCPCRTGLRPLLARRRTLTRQSSVEEDSGEPVEAGHVVRSDEAQPSPERSAPSKYSWDEPGGREDFRDVWKKSIKMSDSRASARHAQPPPRVADGPLILGNPVTAGRADRVDLVGRRFPHGSAGRHRSRPTMVPSADEYGGRNRLSPDFYEESETDPGAEELPPRIFVALFDYDPLTMSPNPDAAEEELPFKEGQIIKVYGDKDADGFYRGETCARLGLIPCNMVSEIQADDEEVMDQLLRQGFLPLNTPVEKIERNRRSSRQRSVATRRMVALYDYDPRESSPNIDVEAELTFCTGDIITVFGEIDEDGFYYGELNGQKGLVPSNFLEEVPDDVEVYLSDAPSHYPQDTPTRSKTKRSQGPKTKELSDMKRKTKTR
ncbi:RIMS-binding protein 2 isoform X5 [Balaenoptera ricei]|uniref:RIMS-binding protein 2 isoform X5 n=1 Tax=Balaenoptera ricei TaxID=2746895 RepID=UPI0028BF529F|nr:RIMS-binding protein 2 isoform X5 [Balaenoptera ricei]